MMIYPVDENHALMITREGKSLLYSFILDGVYTHAPGDYPDMAVYSKNWSIPPFDDVITSNEDTDFVYHDDIVDVGGVLYGNIYPPDLSLPHSYDDVVYIGVMKIPLSHRACNALADGMDVVFGSVNVYLNNYKNILAISFTPRGGGMPSLYSMLYYTFLRPSYVDEIVELALKVMEWDRPKFYNKKIEDMYRDRIMKELNSLKEYVFSSIEPRPYDPVYVSRDTIFVEKPGLLSLRKDEILEKASFVLSV